MTNILVLLSACYYQFELVIIIWMLLYTFIDDTPFSTLSEDIADIMDVLADFDTGRWRTLATNLRLRISSMDNIETNNRNARRCLQLALTDWLKLNYNDEKNGRPSWKKLARAMRPLDGKIFEKIVTKYPGNNYSKLV